MPEDWSGHLTQRGTTAGERRRRGAPPGGSRLAAVLLLATGVASCAETPAAPEAVITASESAGVGAAVTLDGSASSAERPVEYRWSLVSIPAGSQAIMIHPTAEIAYFVPDQPGEYGTRLVVYDGLNDSDPAEKSIQIESCDGSPLGASVEASPAGTVAPDTTVVLRGSRTGATDLPPCGGGPSHACAWSFLPPADSAAVLRGVEGCAPTFVPDLPGIYQATLLLSDDDDNQSAPATAVITVGGCGFRPPVAHCAASAERVNQGELVVLDGSGSFDPDNDAACARDQWLTYSWLLTAAPPGSRSYLDDPTLVNPSLVPDAVGAYRVQLVVSDEAGLRSPAAELVIDADPVPGFTGGAGVIASLTARAPLTSSGGANPQLSIPMAAEGVDGYLSAVDWNRFDSKVVSVGAGVGATIGGTPTEPVIGVLFGPTAGTGVEGNDPRLTDARVPIPGSANYVQNQSGLPQDASYDISGDATVGGDLSVGGVIDAPHNLEIVQQDDPRLTFQPAAFTCGAGEWCEAPGSWGVNRFATDARYTACTDNADCSANWVELRLDDNSYRSVLLSHLDWSNSRVLSIYVSFDGGGNYSFHKAINTQRVTADGSKPHTSSIRTIVSNLPLGADIRVQVVASHGRFHFEGFGLSKMILPGTDNRPYRSIARASQNGPNDTTCDVDAACGPAALASRQVGFVKTQDATAVRVQYIDSMRSYGAGSSRACRYYVRFNGAACPSGDVYGDVYANGSDNAHRSRIVGGYCTGLAAGTYTVQVYVGNTPGYSARCWTGWIDQRWLLEAEEIL